MALLPLRAPPFITHHQTKGRDSTSSKDFGHKLHFRTPSEMAQACKESPEWLRHAEEIAQRCSFEIPLGKPQFPAFRPHDGTTASEFLSRLVHEGLVTR